MQFVGILLISPLWGSLSPRLFFRCWLAFLGVGSLLFCLFTGKPLRKTLFASTLFQQLTEMAFTAALLLAGFIILYRFLPFGASSLETLSFWVFATVQLAILLPRASAKIDILLAKIKASLQPR